MVLAQALFRLLAERPARPSVDVIAPGWSLPLLRRMPEIREAIPLRADHGELALRERWRTGVQLRERGYSQGIVLPRSLKAAIPLLAARIPQRTGYRGEWRYGLLNDIRRHESGGWYRTVDRFMGLALPPGEQALPSAPEPRLTVDRDAAMAQCEQLALPVPVPGQPILGLCPGAEYGPAKRWPAEHFAGLARMYLARGWRVWLFGSNRDAPHAEAIAHAAAGCENLSGRTDLDQAIDLLALTTAVVSNDSGLMHVAAATGRPLAAIYGSSDPKYTPPLSSRARIVYRSLSCSPCFARECPLGHLNCLQGITPSEVEQAVESLVGNGNSTAGA